MRVAGSVIALAIETHSHTRVMSQQEIPRDPGEYFPSEHCVVRKRERGIQWEWVSRTLREGKVHPSMEEDCRVFMEYIPGEGELLRVIANVECGEIVTVAWDDS